MSTEIKIFRPVLTNYVTQKFGESKNCRKGSHVVNKINGVCPPGYEDTYASLGLKGHSGVDLAAYRNEPLYFPVIGDTTWRAKNHIDRHGGKGIDVISNKRVLFQGRESYVKFRFWHLNDSIVYDDQDIFPGQMIGFNDSTGLSTGDHLHWSIKRCFKSGRPLDSDNGFYGAVPFGDNYENKFIYEELGWKISRIRAMNSKAFELRKRIIDRFGQ